MKDWRQQKWQVKRLYTCLSRSFSCAISFFIIRPLFLNNCWLLLITKLAAQAFCNLHSIPHTISNGRRECIQRKYAIWMQYMERFEGGGGRARWLEWNINSLEPMSRVNPFLLTLPLLVLLLQRIIVATIDDIVLPFPSLTDASIFIVSVPFALSELYKLHKLNYFLRDVI